MYSIVKYTDIYPSLRYADINGDEKALKNIPIRFIREILYSRDNNDQILRDRLDYYFNLRTSDRNYRDGNDNYEFEIYNTEEIKCMIEIQKQFINVYS